MTGELKYTTFNTDMGWVGILASASGLLATSLPQQSRDEAHQQLGERVNQATWSPGSFPGLIGRLKAYFCGDDGVTFPDGLDLPAATSFQYHVWEATRLIPYGETRSYLWVATQIDKPGAVRAVGQALGRNPLPVIVPCHRVIANDGSPGGFGGGLELKQRLLNLEAR
ncbi:methylated-DNA--[protein]-cysteine S-methyltransferase [Chloroflexota bacterium]